MASVIRRLVCGCVVAAAALPCPAADDADINLRLTLRDADSGALVPGRITLEQRGTGAGPVYHFVKSLDHAGSAVTYDVARSETSFEKHTTVSAHPFGASVPPGQYVVYYEHGPEWRGNKAQVQVKEGEVTELELTTSRWIDMAGRGWYSGDTHVHRSLEELPNVMLAEDLNVALPLSYWVRSAYTRPAQGDGSIAGEVEPRLIEVDPTHVIWPVNTEYELFTVGGRRHTLGAVFVLNHQRPLDSPAPPVGPVAEEARAQGAILDLDKHSWPWSLMLVPIMDVDLFELSNNHIWRTEFFFRRWTEEMRPEGWNIETDDPLLPSATLAPGEAPQPDTDRRRPPQAQTRRGGFTEWGWIDFGFKTYYALLNCGFRMRPSAGTASGVHPVPLGFGRVYVECPEGFSYGNWMKGLDAGRSFVTTGPMLFAEVDEHPPGSTITAGGATSVRVHGVVEGNDPLRRIEVVRNGRVVNVIPAKNDYESPNIWRTPFDVEVPLEGSSWVAVRCFAGNPAEERTFRFAHSSPVHIDVPGRPLRPRKREVNYFLRRMNDEIERNRDVLAGDELAEYERARDIYTRIAGTAVEDHSTTDEQLLSLVLPADELPAAWSFADISTSELRILGRNPTIISRPDMLGPIGTKREALLEGTNILRTLVAIYRREGVDRATILAAHVCADAASAEYTARLIRGPERLRGRFDVWQRGDAVVWLFVGAQATEDDARAFRALVASRVEALQ